MAKEGVFGKRVRQWRRNRADERLFHHLAQLFELERDDEEVLIALADEHQLVRISEVFVRPSLWQTTDGSGRGIAALKQRVFGSPEQV